MISSGKLSNSPALGLSDFSERKDHALKGGLTTWSEIATGSSCFSFVNANELRQLFMRLPAILGTQLKLQGSTNSRDLKKTAAVYEKSEQKIGRKVSK